MGAVLSRAYNFPSSVISLILCFIMPSNLKIALIIGLVALSIIVIILPFFILFKFSAQVIYWVTVICVGGSAVFSSIISSTAFSIAAKFDSTYTSLVSSGNGCCGVIAAGLRILTKALFSSKEQLIISSAVYFFLTAIVLIITLIYLLHVSKIQTLSRNMISSSGETVKCSRSLLSTIKLIWVEWLSVFFDFLVTLTLFPGYMTLVKEVPAIGDWSSVIITAIFCIFDWVGRYLPVRYMWPSIKFAWIPVLVRVLFFPIFMLTIENVVNLGDPYWTFLWTIPFAVTNGYFGTVSMLYGSNNEKVPSEDRGLAGFLMSFSITAGILAAMFLTFAMPQ
ncbi:Nucleoside transporter family protein [Histomonas meleagridis]|uniref:Nucleoside transporter family protein n=1 Tax=Histomonas meleagridis TaxID=135588 RepID=UPI00355A7DC4|nr:Nucleoside transporter family protein [Histomonas meleagridis]KAH0800521.1 Nucleoside transporter family protein [Histomonas meleagridis]